MTTRAAVMNLSYLGDSPSDLATAVAVVGLAIILAVMVLGDALRKAAPGTHH